ncbi:competence protein ComK [Bacillus sp. USDA818B3_A]|uniref:competence protein ComK n=1 Tax=Bacillus sp. USDA818B3_A TaxID=2698834 RepID=UPI0013681CA5|nr:competence protein ComK [Bacillus sp. USDA818B3_A]
MTQERTGDYIVNSCTMYIRPEEYGSKIFSLIGEVEEKILSPAKPFSIIQKGCAYYGVDYEGRRKGTRLLIDYSRKLPIVIEPITNIYAFCTASPENPKCIWFFAEHIKDYRRVSARETMVIFRNHQSQIFPVSYSTFNTQMLRTSYLQMKLMQRVEINKEKLVFLMHSPKHSKASESHELYLDKRK